MGASRYSMVCAVDMVSNSALIWCEPWNRNLPLHRELNPTMTTATLPPLPALRKLSRLADAVPTIVVDTREQTPLVPTRLPYVRAGLQTGDYSVRGLEDLFTVERKSIADLVACCKSGTKAAEGERERLERELHRMRGFRFARLLVVGTMREIEEGAYVSKIAPSAVLNSLKAWQVRFDIPVVLRDTPADAARQVEDWAWWFAREIVLEANGLARGSVGEFGKEEEGEP